MDSSLSVTHPKRRSTNDEYDAVDVGAVASECFHGVGEKMLHRFLADAHPLSSLAVGLSIALAEQQGLALAVG